MDLAQYKKAWENQPEEKNKVSSKEIYKMTQSKSTSVVKWIFIIGILEFVLLNSLVFFIDLDEAYEQYDKMGLKNFIIIAEATAYIVALVFMVMFYLNYKNISAVDSTKRLMTKILKTRRTVKLYVLFNLTYFFIVMIVVGTTFVLNTPQDIPDDRIGLVIAVFVIAGLIALGLVWLFYQLIYGLLLSKLKKNYKELSKLELK